MISNKTTTAACLALSFCCAADAATLSSPPFAVNRQGDQIACQIANVSSRARTVRIRVIDNFGNVTLDAGTQLLGAAQVAKARSVASISSDGVAYCRFDVQGSRDNFRAAAAIYDVNPDHDTLIIPAQ